MLKHEPSSGSISTTVSIKLEAMLVQTTSVASEISVCILMHSDFTAKAQDDSDQQSRPKTMARWKTTVNNQSCHQKSIERSQTVCESVRKDCNHATIKAQSNIDRAIANTSFGFCGFWLPPTIVKQRDNRLHVQIDA